ncbi:uncharacterized protein I303_105601 [Kwoniella dejecticola CBS 10117]|uniref:Uncharacterized protein n=1 Tax=Kwoniella dejecticola CBS 10117 TaxID=1296121 RepID=A0A1A6A245_9TREE|nr:uncharacterized protein I303_04956 [Kwoniella dejecticola CBS 10117]OBR84099.1 hypothetical protein I303_04956 [Kwoniella dejecticola CBS 10117]
MASSAEVAEVLDRRILSVIWELLNSDSSPNELFGCPALRLNDIYAALNVKSEQLDLNNIVSIVERHTADLVGDGYTASLKSVRRGQSKEYYIVFQLTSQIQIADSKTHESRSSALSDQTPLKKPTEKLDEDAGQVKTIGLIPGLPGAESHATTKAQPKSAKQKIFRALGWSKKKDPSEAVTQHDVNNKSRQIISQHEDDRTIDIQAEHESMILENMPATEQASMHRNFSSSPIGLSPSTHNRRDNLEEQDGSDWLEKTRGWHRPRASHEDIENTRENDAEPKPERKGTEWDIIDAYSYDHDEASDLDDTSSPAPSIEDRSKVSKEQDTDNAPRTRDGLSKRKLKSSFGQNEISINHRPVREPTKDEFEGTIAEYFDEYAGNEHEEDDADASCSWPQDIKGTFHEERRDRHDHQHNHKHTNQYGLDHESNDDVKHPSSDRQHRHNHENKDGHRRRAEADRPIEHQHREKNQKDELSKSENNRRSDREDIRRRSEHNSHRSIRERDREREQETKREGDHTVYFRSKKDKQYHVQVDTPFLLKSFEGLPFEPDLSVFDSLAWMKDKWQLVVAELIAVLGIVYILQASGF